MVTSQQRLDEISVVVREALVEVQKVYSPEVLQTFPFRFWEVLESKLAWSWMQQVKEVRKEEREKARSSYQKLVKKRVKKEVEEVRKKMIRKGLVF